jgi:hypothetical protein
MLSPRIKGAVCHDPEVDQRFLKFVPQPKPPEEQQDKNAPKHNRGSTGFKPDV